MSDDWQVVENALAHTCDEDATRSLRECEARWEAENKKLYEMGAKYKARVAELENKLNEDSQTFHIETLKAERELLTTRVARLEEEVERSEQYAEERDLIAQRYEAALEKIADPETDAAYSIAAAALAHEEEK